MKGECNTVSPDALIYLYIVVWDNSFLYFCTCIFVLLYDMFLCMYEWCITLFPLGAQDKFLSETIKDIELN